MRWCSSLTAAANSAIETAGRRLPLCPARHPPQSVAACLFIVAGRNLSRIGSKSRETIWRIDPGGGRARRRGPQEPDTGAFVMLLTSPLRGLGVGNDGRYKL